MIQLKKLFFFSILFNLSILQAQNISDVNWGFSFEVPQEWKYQKDESVAMFGHDIVAGLILLFPHQLTSMDALKLEMQRGLSDDGIYLQLEGSLESIDNNSFVGNYVGVYQMQEVKAKAYGTLSSHGGGAFVIALSTPESYSRELAKAGESIIKSLEYKKKERVNGVNSAQMSNYFVGKWSTYTKYSETHIYFYSNGTYKTSDTSSYGNSDASVGATWGGASDNYNGGRWQVQGNMKSGRISLVDNSGKSSYIDYLIQGREMYFNGTLYGYTQE